MIHLFPSAIVVLSLATAAHADVTARFIEGAPKDRFEIRATSECLNAPLTVSIDLSGSAGALIFDVTSQGAGVEVFQPFELVAGGAFVSASSSVKDGDKTLELVLTQLPKAMPVSFTIDVDDTLSDRQITVNGAEIEGASLRISMGDTTQSATFGANAQAVIESVACSS